MTPNSPCSSASFNTWCGKAYLAAAEHLNHRTLCCLNHPQGAKDNSESCRHSGENLIKQSPSGSPSGLKELMPKSLLESSQFFRVRNITGSLLPVQNAQGHTVKAEGEALD